MVRIEKKTWPAEFQSILNEEKKFDLRLADWKCNVGDILVLKEYNPETKEYTGRAIEKKITYILKTKDLAFFNKEEADKYGYQVLSLE